jgi:hypothetical protein
VAGVYKSANDAGEDGSGDNYDENREREFNEGTEHLTANKESQACSSSFRIPFGFYCFFILAPGAE